MTETELAEARQANYSAIGYEGVLDALVDDLNTPAALVTMQSLARSAIGGHPQAVVSLEDAAMLMGLNLVASSDVAPTDLPAKVAERLAALNGKDFAKADQIRAQLLTQGVQLMDYKDEAGQRQTKWEVVR